MAKKKKGKKEPKAEKGKKDSGNGKQSKAPEEKVEEVRPRG